jgi:mannosyltransferase PIG-V
MRCLHSTESTERPWGHALRPDAIERPGWIRRDLFRSVRLFLARDTVALLVWAVGFRIASACAGFFVNVIFPLHQREQFTVFREPHMFWDTFARYDSGWYNGIARSGYRFAEGGRSNLAFFPLYPMLMRAFGRPFGTRPHNFYLAGIVISWAAFVIAMLVLYRLARLDVSKRAANRAVLLAAMFPFGFFYGMVYAESLFLMLLLIAVYALRTKRWLIAALGGALATATRVNGIMALPALFWIGWHSASDRRERRYAMAAAACASAGIVIYSIYVHYLTGSFFEWYFSITRWRYFPGTHSGDTLLLLLRQLVTQPYAYLVHDSAAPFDVLNGLTACAFLAAIPFVTRKLGWGYGLLMLANLALPVSSGAYEGLGRYCAVLFPMFIWLGTVRLLHIQMSILAAFGMAYLLCLTLFVNLYPLF